MTRKPDPNSRTATLILRAKPEWEKEIRAFKEICARNGIEYNQELFRRGVQGFLREHNWPPGNSQTLISVFTEQKLIQQKCWCGEIATHKAWSLEDELFYLCPLHHKRNRTARLLKRWKVI